MAGTPQRGDLDGDSVGGCVEMGDGEMNMLTVMTVILYLMIAQQAQVPAQPTSDDIYFSSCHWSVHKQMLCTAYNPPKWVVITDPEIIRLALVNNQCISTDPDGTIVSSGAACGVITVKPCKVGGVVRSDANAKPYCWYAKTGHSVYMENSLDNKYRH